MLSIKRLSGKRLADKRPSITRLPSRRPSMQRPSMRRPSTRVPAIAAGAVVLLALAGAGTAVAMERSSDTSISGTPAPPPSLTKGFPSGKGNPGIFTERCGFSHEAPNDPIMMPGQTSMSMHHDFFGNTATDADSTAKSLLSGKTTCKTSADSSGYWIPQMYQNGKAITPQSANIYWRRPRTEQDAIQTVPAGLQIIAGNAAATTPLGVDKVAWSCAERDGRNLGTGKTGQGGKAGAQAGTLGAAAGKATASPHTCPAGSRLKETLLFPSCWDGHNLNAMDHTNMAYLGKGKAGCPASHPVQIPQILFHVIYPTSSASGIRLSLTPTTTASSTSAHADFLNGWTQNALDTDVQACIATSTRCGPVSGPRATPQGPTAKQRMKLNEKARHGKHHKIKDHAGPRAGGAAGRGVRGQRGGH